MSAQLVDEVDYEPPRCGVCGEIPPNPGIPWAAWQEMEYCPDCVPRPGIWRKADLLAEINLLIGTDTVDNIARRLGYLDKKNLCKTLNADHKDVWNRLMTAELGRDPRAQLPTIRPSRAGRPK